MVRKLRPGRLQGCTAGFVRLEHAEDCGSERRHFGSEAIWVTKSPGYLEIFTSASREDKRGNRPAPVASCEKGEISDTDLGLFVQVLPPEKASETIIRHLRSELGV